METNALDEAALIDNLMLLVADSIENVWAGMASALVLLIENVDAVRAWLDGGGTWVGIVDECPRLESPGQYQGRIALEALEIGGVALPRNAVVLVGLAAANRDPSVFEDPEAFRPNR